MNSPRLDYPVTNKWVNSYKLVFALFQRSRVYKSIIDYFIDLGLSDKKDKR